MRRGTVNDGPWGLTLASLAQARASGQLTLTADDGKLYCIALARGAITGASSPFASDSAARVALTSRLVTPSQVPALARTVAASPGRDEVEVIAEATGLVARQADQLRRRVLLQRVARTFAVERGGYVLGQQVTVAAMRGIEVDVGQAIFLGVRRHLSQDRLAGDLRRFGARFVLRAEVDEARFGFTEHERPILQALRIGTSLPELEARRRDLEPRLVQAVIYTLVASGLCEGVAAPRSREPSAAPPAAAGTAAAEAAAEAAIARARTTTYEPRSRRGQAPRTKTVSSLPPPIPRPGDVLAAREVIAAGLAQLDAGADHFALLGVPRDAAIDSIRAAYVSLACHLHPDKRPELDAEAARDAQRLFAQVNVAYGVLGDPVRRAEYLAQLPAPASRPHEGDPPSGTAAERVRAAMEVAQRGMQALRREDLPAAIELLARAAELAPQNAEYPAQLAWARFCASTDKPGIAGPVRRALERAIGRSPRPVLARFYLGRVERMLGRVHEALQQFREVIQLEPNHAEAAAEIRLLEPRSARR